MRLIVYLNFALQAEALAKVCWFALQAEALAKVWEFD